MIEHLRVQDVRHTGRSFFAHLDGTHDLLRDWGDVTERPKVSLDNVGRSEILVRDHFADTSIHLRPEDLGNLLEIEGAELIEQGGNASSMRQLQKADISGAAKASIAKYLENSMAS